MNGIKELFSLLDLGDEGTRWIAVGGLRVSS